MIELCCKYLFVCFIWLYVVIKSCICSRVNLNSTVAWMPRNSLLKTDTISKTIDMKEVYNLCVLSNPKHNDIDILISKMKAIKTRRDRNIKHKFFFAKPISWETKQYHQEFKNHEHNKRQSWTDFYLIYIWWIIIKKKKKKTKF